MDLFSVDFPIKTPISQGIFHCHVSLPEGTCVQLWLPNHPHNLFESAIRWLGSSICSSNWLPMIHRFMIMKTIDIRVYEPFDGITWLGNSSSERLPMIHREYVFGNMDTPSSLRWSLPHNHWIPSGNSTVRWGKSSLFMGKSTIMGTPNKPNRSLRSPLDRLNSWYRRHFAVAGAPLNEQDSKSNPDDFDWKKKQVRSTKHFTKNHHNQTQLLGLAVPYPLVNIQKTMEIHHS